MLFGLCLDCDVILEQPLSSLMLLHPRMQQLVTLADTGCIRQMPDVTTFMGSFGAETLKPTALFGSPSWLQKLRRDTVWFNEYKLSSSAAPRVTRYQVDDLGKMRFWGDDGMKKTQIYPIGYGEAILDILRKEPIVFDTSADFCWDAFEVVGPRFRTNDLAHWLDAGLTDVWRTIMDGQSVPASPVSA